MKEIAAKLRRIETFLLFSINAYEIWDEGIWDAIRSVSERARIFERWTRLDA